MKKKFIKIIFYNFLVFIFFLIILFLILNILSKTLGGFSGYRGGYFNLNLELLVRNKSKKNKNIKYDDFYRIFDHNYEIEKYSGVIKKSMCGYRENGKYHMFFKTDKNGFRENLDKYYRDVDFVVLGDSTVLSVCVNKPYDLLSLLRNNNKDKTFLNLGAQGSQPITQLAYFDYYLKDTNFKKFIWVYTEANDYEPYNQKIEILYKNLKNKEIEKKLKPIKNYGLSTVQKIKLLNEQDITEIDYKVYPENISFTEKFKIYLSESLMGIGTLAKYFKTYPELIHYKEYEKIIKLMKINLDKKKIKERYIYYSPSYIYFGYKKLPNHPQFRQFLSLKLKVKKIAEENGFIFIDGYEAFADSNKDVKKIFHYGLPTHFNEYGYSLTAKHISDSIVNKDNK